VELSSVITTGASLASAALFPEALNERVYASTPDFVWGKARAPVQYSNPAFDAFYNGWERDYWMKHRIQDARTALAQAGLMVAKFVHFFLWPELCVPLLALPWLLRDRRVRFLGIQVAFCFFGSFSLLWFLPHYASPATGTAFGLLTQLLRHLRRSQVGTRQVGVGLSRAIVIMALALAPFHQRDATIDPPAPDTYRKQS